MLAATESSDGYTGTVPEQIAALLGLPSITFAKEIHIEGDKVDVQRQTEAGYDEVTCPMPAVVSVTAGVVEPRYPSFKGIMAAKSKPVEELKVADLGLDAGQVGAAGAGQEIIAVEDAPGPRGRRDHRGRRRSLQPHRRLPRRPQGHLSRDPRRNEQTWLSTPSGSTPRPTTARSARSPSSCSPRPARSAAPSRRSTPATTPTRSPARSAPTAPPRSTAPATSAARSPACRWPPPSPRRSRAAAAPTCSCSAPPTRAATSPPACRWPSTSPCSPTTSTSRSTATPSSSPSRSSVAPSW